MIRSNTWHVEMYRSVKTDRIFRLPLLESSLFSAESPLTPPPSLPSDMLSIDIRYVRVQPMEVQLRGGKTLNLSCARTEYSTRNPR